MGDWDEEKKRRIDIINKRGKKLFIAELKMSPAKEIYGEGVGSCKKTGSIAFSVATSTKLSVTSGLI
jgi:tRNA A58 N-methylase Trm61